jgi:acyl-homoserine lactone acylase PvdQ
MSVRLTLVPYRCTAVLLAAMLALALCPAAPARAEAALPDWQTPVAKTGAEYARLQREARNVTITRDDWGIAHIHGPTDADAVFGMIYAQCEDDFNRVEMNYLTALGWSAQAEGESAIWDNLRYQLFIDPTVLRQDYAEETDERMGRRHELVPGHAPRGASEGHPALRAVDGIELHRRQYRRRHRARGPRETREVLRREP